MTKATTPQGYELIKREHMATRADAALVALKWARKSPRGIDRTAVELRVGELHLITAILESVIAHAASDEASKIGPDFFDSDEEARRINELEMWGPQGRPTR